MRHLAYVGMLVVCLVGTLPLEVVLGARVYRQWRRLALAVLCAAPPFVAWDLYATHAGHWDFDEGQTLGVTAAGLPLEELLFFVVVPVCSVLALEAVRTVRGWPVGDER